MGPIQLEDPGDNRRCLGAHPPARVCLSLPLGGAPRFVVVGLGGHVVSGVLPPSTLLADSWGLVVSMRVDYD